MNLRPVPRRLLVLSLLAGIAACSGPQFRPGDEALRSDRAVVRLLALVEASREQQDQVLAAYDVDAVRRREIERDLQTLNRERGKLDPHQPDFLAANQAWVQRWTALMAERYAIQARFDVAVAGALKSSQWEDWVNYTTAQPSGYGGYGEGGPGRRSGGP